MTALASPRQGWEPLATPALWRAADLQPRDEERSPEVWLIGSLLRDEDAPPCPRLPACSAPKGTGAPPPAAARRRSTDMLQLRASHHPSRAPQACPVPQAGRNRCHIAPRTPAAPGAAGLSTPPQLSSDGGVSSPTSVLGEAHRTFSVDSTTLGEVGWA